jgi:hypothetical protein
MKTKRLLPRLALAFLLALPAALALGQAPDSFSGWTVLLDSSDPGVSEKLVFNASKVTTTFKSSDEEWTYTSNYTFTKTGANTVEIATPNTDGSEDKYLFQFTSSEGGAGELKDYVMGNYAGQSLYQLVSGSLYLDLSGSWTFTFEKLPAWEDYDDFADNSLDASVWDVGHWDGGVAPVEVNGRIELKGNTVPGFNTTLATASMLASKPDVLGVLNQSFSNSNGQESHSFLELKDKSLRGIEVEFTLPSDAHGSTAIGLMAVEWGKTFSDQWENGFFGLDLWSDHIDVEYTDPSTSQFVDGSVSAQPNTTYRLALVFNETKNLLYVNDEKAAEFSSANFDIDAVLFRGMNESGEPFTAYVDNVRVLRNWEDYDDFSGGSLSTDKWDLWWGAGGRSPAVVNGALELAGSGNLNDPASSSVPEGLNDIPTENLPSKHSVALIEDENIYGLEAEFMIPSGAADDTGLNFICFDFASDGSKKEFGPELEYRVDEGLALEFAYDDPVTGESKQISRAADFDTYYKMSLIHTDSTNAMFLNGEKIVEYSSAGFDADVFGFAAFNDDGHPYSTYVKNVRVLRSGQTSTEPQATTVVSTPDGKPVVVQVGDVYKWNDSLDGVTLWGVWEDEDDGWTAATIQYVNGKQKGNIGLYDQLTTNLIVDHPYVVDESGMIKVTEDTAYQYYQVKGVENGVIQTADDSVFPLSDTSWFFTNKAAAQEYYYSKAGYPNPKGWLWLDQYPWVYSDEEKGWLYFKPSGDKIHYYSVRDKAWREFVPKQP